MAKKKYVLVRYKNGAMMSYSLTAYSPLEGFRVVFNGTKGRIELDVSESVYVNGKGNVSDDPLKRAASHVDGVTSIMTGVCANKSIASGLPIKVEEVLGKKIKDLK